MATTLIIPFLDFQAEKLFSVTLMMALWKVQSHMSSELLRATLSTWFSHIGKCCLLFAFMISSPPLQNLLLSQCPCVLFVGPACSCLKT